MTEITKKKSMRSMHRVLLIGVTCSGLVLTGCTNPNDVKPETIDTVSTAEYQINQEFSECKGNGLTMSASAKQRQSPAQYMSSAETFQQCLSDLGPYKKMIKKQDRMQVHALSILNYLKGGDAGKARTQLNQFEIAYPNSDLHFDDYTSFIDSMKVILGTYDDKSPDAKTLNINDAIQVHMSRQSYWEIH